MKNILAIDIGTHCGIALKDGFVFICWTEDLATPGELKKEKLSRFNRRNDIRVNRLYALLKQLHHFHKFDIVIFEDVQFASSTYQVQLWASLRAALWLAFPADSKVIVECVSVGTLKKFATGSGAATKEMMSEALQQEHPEKWDEKFDENQIDAAWLWLFANTHLTRSPKKDTVGV